MMVDNSQGRKKSQFPAETTVLSGAFFDYFRDGVNTKISFTDLLGALNVTGSIIQDGAATGTPILDTQGDVHAIRNVEDGPGIMSSVSPENGLALEHNFIAGSGGARVLVDVAEPQPIIKNLVPGVGISIDGSASDSITISASGGAPATNIVNVFDVTDFPAPVGDVITLDANTTYNLQTLVNLGANRIVTADLVEMFSDSRLSRGLTSTTTGALITTGNGDAVVIEDMIWDAPNGSYLATSGLGNLVTQNIIGTASAIISTLGPMNTLTFGPMSLFSGTSFGFLFTGAHNQFNIYRGFYEEWNGVLFDFGTATFSEGITFGTGVRMVGGVGDTFISGLPNSGNIAVGATALVLGNKFIGDGTRLAGITNEDARWQFIGNDTIGDTRPDGLLSMQGNATPTVIAVAGTPVLVAGTWVVERTSQMTGTTAGRLTYNPDKPLPLPITASVTIDPVSGANIIMGVFIALNGVFIANSAAGVETDSGTAVRVTVPWQLEFTSGDFVEIFVSNETNTNNLLVSAATLLTN